MLIIPMIDLDSLFGKDDLDAIEWMCSNCGHSWKKHKHTNCSNGKLRRCNCADFKISTSQVRKVRKQLQQIEDKLFEDFGDAKSLEIKN